MVNFENGYDNSACNPNDDIGITQIPSIEMDRVTDTRMNEVIVAGCCGGGLNGNKNHQSGDQPNEKDVCQPKCPAVRSTPWDPIKTRFVAVLAIAMVAWVLIGVLVKNL